MLSKLIKYDFKAINRLAIPLSGIALIVAMFGTMALRFLLTTAERGPSLLQILCGMFVGASVFALIAYAVVIFIFMVIRFYTNLYTDEGYLTFTLPVKPAQLILSKLITSVTWSLISLFVIAVSIFIFISFGTASGKELITLEWVKELGGIPLFNQDLATLPLGLLNLLTSDVFNFLAIFLSITIAAVITRRLKFLVAIGIYYGINTVISILTTIGEVIPGLLTEEIDSMSMVVSVWNWISVVIYLAFSVVAFLVCNYLMKRKLNLD